jgi:hypothetical protein
MAKESPPEKNKKKTNLRLGKVTYGDMPIEECFRKAFEPYFNPEVASKKGIYLNRLR